MIRDGREKMARRKMRRRNKRAAVFKSAWILTLAVILISLGCKACSHLLRKNAQGKNVVQAEIKDSAKNKAEETTGSKEEKEKKMQPSGTDLIKGSNVTVDGDKYAYDVEKLNNILDKKEQGDGKKMVFLTFDDGPSTTVTPEVLDELKKHEVKATFFLLGENVERNERSKELVRRTLEEGHALGNHTYTHDLKKLYPGNKVDVGHYMEEVDKTNHTIRNVVGQDFNTRVIRMPGGYMSRAYYHDPNLGEFKDKLREKNMHSMDWNAYDRDSEKQKRNAAQLVEEVKKSATNKEKVVLLMHDTYGKEETAKALPQIIEYFKEQGYEFRTFK